MSGGIAWSPASRMSITRARSVDADEAEDEVHDADVGVEQPAPDEGNDDPAGHDGQEVDASEQVARGDAAVQGQCEGEAAEVDEGQVPDQVVERVEEGAVRRRILDELDVVVEADPLH